MVAEGGSPGSRAEIGPGLPSSSSDCDDSLLRQVAGCDDDDPPEAVALPALYSVLDGKYRLEKLLGRGGMGCVFAAKHLATGRSVAIKWMLRRGDLRQLRKRFVREARAAGRIRHPNVIDVYDVVSSDDATYLVLELLEGESLRSRLSRGVLSHDEAVTVGLAMLDGLAEAHRQGVIHRDLKPENVFLCDSPGGEVKLLDFGISVLREVRPLPESNLTRTGYFVGTPVYTALERLREKQPFDHRVDLYSVGVILYEALTGDLPFSGRSPSELTYQLATGAPRGLRELRPDVPAALETVVLRALARDPNQRFADAQSLADALRVALHEPPLNARARQRRAQWVRVALAAAAVGALAAWVGPAFEPQRGPGAVRAAAGGLGKIAAARATALGRLRENPPPAQAAPAVETGEKASEPVTPAPRNPGAPRQRAPGPPHRAVLQPAETQKALAPTAAEEQSAAAATLTVVAFPYGNVWVNGKSVGPSPATLTLPPGRHTVSAGPETPERHSVVNLGSGDVREVVVSWTKRQGAAASQAGNPLAPGDLHAAGRSGDVEGNQVRPRPASN